MNQPLVINGVTINNEEDINEPCVQDTIGEIADYMIGIRQELPYGVNNKTLRNIIRYMSRSLLLGQIDPNDTRNNVANAILDLHADLQITRPLGDGSNLPRVDFSFSDFSDAETSESESNDEPNRWCCRCDLL
jgi:hypothetical protein